MRGDSDLVRALRNGAQDSISRTGEQIVSRELAVRPTLTIRPGHPVNVLVTLSFALISEAGRVLEDPFNMFWNGLPLSQISAMIEVNVRELMGDSELPPIPKPTKRGILM